MIVKVLGSAAGGGFPQANCNCRNCADVRLGKPGLQPRTQSSIAISLDGRRWVLLNASPDLRQQIAAVPELAPHCEAGVRSSPISTVVLTNADVDHVAGLLSLRECFRFTLHGSPRVLDALAANNIFNVLAASLVPRVAMTLGQPVEPLPGLTIEAFAVPGKVALYLEDDPGFGTREGDTIGLEVRETATGGTLHYVPGCAAIDQALIARLSGSPLALFDGTLYTDDEMISQGLSAKTGARMGHLAISGAKGSMAALRSVDIGRRIYVHLNNSNPVLREYGAERAEVERAGWEVAFDGMEIRL